MSGLIGHLIDTVASLNSSRAEKMTKGMGCNGVRISIENSVDLPTA